MCFSQRVHYMMREREKMLLGFFTYLQFSLRLLISSQKLGSISAGESCSVEFTKSNQWFGLQIPVGIQISSQTPKMSLFQTIDLKTKEINLKLDNGYLIDYRNAEKNLDLISSLIICPEITGAI
jgi:hypothetical protein